MPLDSLFELGGRVLQTTLFLAAPPLIAGVLIGVVLHLYQSIVLFGRWRLVKVRGKIVVVALLLSIMPWVVDLVVRLTMQLFLRLPGTER